MDIKSVLFALLVVLVWGVNFSVIKVGLETLPPIFFSGLRFFIVALPAVFFYSATQSQTVATFRCRA